MLSLHFSVSSKSMNSTYILNLCILFVSLYPVASLSNSLATASMYLHFSCDEAIIQVFLLLGGLHSLLLVPNSRDRHCLPFSTKAFEGTHF